MIRWTQRNEAVSEKKGRAVAMISRALVSFVAILFAVSLITLFGANAVVRRVSGEIKSGTGAVGTSTVAIVLGAKVYDDGGLSAMLEDRVETGVDLYGAGKVKKLLMSGDHGREGYDEVNAMRRYAIALGVPERDIFTDHAGFSTYESLLRARDVFKVKDAVVVSQRFHLPRALFLARAVGLDAQVVSADKRPYLTQRSSAFRENFANVKAVWQTAIKARPTLLGPVIPINGDGRASRG